jgi:hypothetical protein
MEKRRGALCQGSRVEIRRRQSRHLTLTDRQTVLLQWMTRERALVINVTLLHDWKPRALLLAPVMKQKIGKEILIF